ncbi:MAG TPA: MarR family transcriptional regulator [Gaiellaceae bacterium]|jgi:DNA-binding MarR family transcriptional regulator|nr:MarR family transcriptional regulator [Gaiellaceae bacterium]
MSRTVQPDAILEELGRLLRQLTRATGGAEDGPAMTATQRIALVELGTEGPLRLNDLARQMGTSAPTASRAVDALESLGLVTRTPEPGDRRALRIELTRAGKALRDDRIHRATIAFAPALEALRADERRALLDYLTRMADAMRDAG